MTRRRLLSAVLAFAVLTGLAVTVLYGRQLVYLAKAGVFQAELLYGRVPLDEALAGGDFDDTARENLQRVPRIKAFGQSIGLSATANYSTVNPTWTRTIYNVSGAEELALVNKSWWFPIVGSVPYLGFFDETAANTFADGLRAEGLDVYVRTAGAYSTLGWFEDPLTPTMLKWREDALSNTILHELAHATVWVPGSVQFNESFANFVGDEASLRYLIATYGADSPELKEVQDRRADGLRWRTFMQGVYQDLDAAYKDVSLNDEQKRARKAAIFGSLPHRIDQAGFADPERWKAFVTREPWNNARMMQYRTYNRSLDQFQKLYEAEGSDLLAFMRAVERVTAGASDPYKALAKAVGDPQ